MTISTPRTDLGGAAPSPRGVPPSPARSSVRSVAGFTLSEVMISAALSAFVLAGVLSAFLLMGRSGFLASSYSELQNQTRRALDIFGEDVRKAVDLRWNSAQSITLSLVTSGNGVSVVTYTYDADPASSTYRCFYRKLGDARSTSSPLILVREVASDFIFERFKLEQAGRTDNTATTDLETKQIQVTFRVARSGVTTVAANQSALSARYILRNKRVSN